MSQSWTISTLAERLGGAWHGDDVAIDHVASLESAASGALAFLANPRFKPQMAQSAAAAVVLKAADAEGLTRPHIVAKDPHLFFARAAQLLHPARVAQGGVHPSATVSDAAQVDASAQIGPGVVVEAGARIAAGAILLANVYVGRDVIIGEGALLYPQVCVLDHCEIGARVILHPAAIIGADGFGNAWAGDHWEKIPQLGRVIIGDDVEIGACTTVDRGALEDTVIGQGARLDNLIQVAHNVEVGAHTAMAACVGIAGSTKIGARCQIGGAAMISGHLEIADGTVVLGGTLVAKTIHQSGVYSGSYPMQEHGDWLKNAAQLRHLNELVQRVKQLEKQLTALQVASGEEKQ
ncbi:UDP-3-O-[3-hydroxymyristoyl] glucosamine N-acyltransferase [Andreprevotia lacus DSM 23236]|jgi:UDP-3-O-[3-hydroxymyristoyl] glucosamine N-acyltransferase|uniref:UDP-3-O-acylglucosamine N-acyltransferase n=1 Tax=Andreprevotia lacus DSM 23236 TaxID=1121001 RepID=A0A1W1XLJ9_9NEIS|nr:UDP-3-O-(3-hydroxymyristoyl)glucosamine N-acyltransferase [Andreprevotia lacus]SMC24765.1 UDP-3-O-[3-hydroxymyristoyl] glucosamine N-acyltransferase [Andreprevotia lacus DSM 23236]